MPAKSSLPRYKYNSISEAMPDIIAEYLGTGKPTGTLYKKYSKLTARPFSLATLMVYLNRNGASQARKAAGFTRPKVNRNTKATPGQIRTHAQTAQLAKQALQDKALEHTGRMIAQIDKVHTVLDKRRLNNKNVGRHLSEVDKFDLVARRTFQMDEGEELTPQQFNIGVLLQIGAENLTPILESPLQGHSLPSGTPKFASEPPDGYNHPPEGSDA